MKTKKSLFEMTQDDLDWIESRRTSRAYEASFKVEITEDYDLRFTYSQLECYHNNIHSCEVLTITMPEVIHKAFYEIESRATKEIQRNMRSLLGL